MKVVQTLNVQRQAAEEVASFLARLPNLTDTHVHRQGTLGLPDNGVDIVAESSFAGKPLRLLIEVKANGQPRTVRSAAAQLHHYMRNHTAHAIPVVMAPYLSRQAREVCRNEGVGYLDFMGNALIASDGLYIEREVPGRPESERRALRSLYKPKSARVLRQLLREPGRPWRTTELAHAAGVSVGLVSNVGAVLRERSWAEQTDEGLSLTDPNALLDSWSENYEPPRGEEYRRYTALHGSALTERLRDLALEDGRVALASFSAAEWLAPFVRHPNTYFYADEAGLAALDSVLGAKPTTKGANVIIVVPEEDGVLDDVSSVAKDIVVTSPVQTYLDLLQTSDRGEEGAAELRRRLLDWPA